LEKGTVIESGSHEELLGNEKGLYRYLSQLQFEV
jgi:ABC-type multidrug transport system fused ATPase/permease subunit